MASILDSVADRTKAILGGFMPQQPAQSTFAGGMSYGDPYIDYLANRSLDSNAVDPGDVWNANNEVDPMSAFGGGGSYGDPVAAAVNRTSGNPYAPRVKRPVPTIGTGTGETTNNVYTDLEVRNVQSTPQQEAFLQKFTPIAEDIEKRYGIPQELTIAIAATETGWGSKVPPGNAWFGLKAQSGQPSVNFNTQEVVNGQRVDTNDAFSAYASPEAAADDFARLLTQAPRYKHVMELARQGRVSMLPQALFDAGYATDPNIVTVYKDIMGQSNVNRMTNRYSTFSQGGQGSGSAGGGKGGDLGANALAAGYKYIGTPYVFGSGRNGSTANLDCSSFVSQSFRDVGVKLTPYTDAMINETQAINVKDLQPGDLVFWRWDDPNQPGTKYSHVGIYKGNGVVLNATSPGGVQESFISAFAGTPVFRRVVRRG